MLKTEEASTLGLKPGEWPKTITHEGETYRLDKGVYENGELVKVTYINDCNVLVVFND